MPHWQSRIDGIVERIRAADPDVLVLQEAYDTAFQEEIVSRLKDLYPHFFLHLGVGSLGGLGPGGVMMATKGAVKHFSDHPFDNNPPTQCRSFGSLELLDQPQGKPFARFIGTHPAWREEEEKERGEQFEQMHTYIQEQDKSCPMPTFLVADTNLERDKEGEALKTWLKFYYKENAPTCWHRFPMTWKEDHRFAQSENKNRPRQIDNIMNVLSDKVTSPDIISCVRIESYLA